MSCCWLLHHNVSFADDTTPAMENPAHLAALRKGPSMKTDPYLSQIRRDEQGEAHTGGTV